MVAAGRAQGGTGYRQTGGTERSGVSSCRVPPLYPLTRAREGRADLSAVGQQRDPLAPPAGRRRHFLNSGWGLVRPRRRRIRWCGRRAGRAVQLRGHRQRAASKDQQCRRVDHVSRSSLSIGEPLLPDPLAPPAGRVADSIFAKFGSGRTLALGRWRRTIDHAVAGERREPRGHRQRAASKDQRYRGRVPPLYPLTRAHEGRADPATLVSRATRDQTDPPAPPAGRRRQFQWVPPQTARARFRLGANDGARAFAANADDDLAAAAGRAVQLPGHRPTRGIETPAV